jgi:long-chain fatty acid transport protein
MLMNPASIVELDSRVDFYVDLIWPSITLDPGGLIGTRRSGEMHFSEPIGSPGLGYVTKWRDYSIGVGMFGAAGTAAEYDHPRSILGLADNADRRSTISLVRLPLTIAKRFDNGWSAGLTLKTSVTSFRTDSITLGLLPTKGDNKVDLSPGIGFTVGLHKRWEKLAFGASYTSRQWFGSLSEYDDLVLHGLDQPQNIQAGFAYRVTPKVELLADYKWVNWSRVNQFGKSGIRSAVGWEDTHLAKFGVRYKPSDKWTFRFGVSHGDGPIDRDDIFINGLFPAINETHWNAGLSYALKDNFDLNFSFTHGPMTRMSDNGKGDLFSKLGKGTEISIEYNTVAVGLSWKL